MVLDWLVNIRKAEKRPWHMLPLGFAYTSVTSLIALLIFPANAAPVALVLLVLAFTPLMLNLMKAEEVKDECKKKVCKIKLQEWLFKEHWPAMLFFIYMFVGMLLAYSTLYALLPVHLSQSLFSLQIQTISSRVAEFGALAVQTSLTRIFLNNMEVLAVSLFLSFIFGAGAIFILGWNAAVLGVLFGNALRHVQNFSALRYLVHGIPEITAYFIAGLSGGIISIAVARHKFEEPDFTRVVKDSVELILLAVAILVAAALIEVYVSPLIG